MHCDELTTAIQTAIEVEVPITTICLKSKRWWTKELTQLCRCMNKLGRISYKYRNNPSHPVHLEHKESTKTYSCMLENTKQQHWRDWLEWAVEPNIWDVHKVVSAAASDGAKACILALKYKQGEIEKMASSNKEKAQILTKSFFPPKLADAIVPNNYVYPDLGYPLDLITREQISHQICKLKPYKAPGPDSIPNIILIRCTDLLLDRLLYIYKAILECNLQYAPWKTFTTIVLQKPSKPRYDVPKVYHPIALLNTMWKILMAIVADQLTYYSEKHNLLPDCHFGGRLGCTTTDALHLLTHQIKTEWRQRNIISVLFLDVKGTFPNAIPERLVHNLCNRHIPQRYTNFVVGMLKDRIMYLKFDNHTSEAININNGIGQGDPLSMVLYQFYNADILDIPRGKVESAIAYVDNALILAVAKNFTKTHNMLANMLTREGGIYEWPNTHNFLLKLSKLALIDFVHRTKQTDRPPLTVAGSMFTPMDSVKYLGIMVDQHLTWKMQHNHTIEKGSKWALKSED